MRKNQLNHQQTSLNIERERERQQMKKEIEGILARATSEIMDVFRKTVTEGLGASEPTVSNHVRRPKEEVAKVSLGIEEILKTTVEPIGAGALAERLKVDPRAVTYALQGLKKKGAISQHGSRRAAMYTARAPKKVTPKKPRTQKTPPVQQ